MFPFFLFVNDLNIETERTETVIAADHRTHGVLHPTIVEVPLAFGQRFHKFPHGLPCSRTHPLWLPAVNGDPLLPFPDIASVLNGILILGHQVRIDRLANGCDSYFAHNIILLSNSNVRYVAKYY